MLNAVSCTEKAKEFAGKCKKTLDTALQKWYNSLRIGVWRRLVARFLGVEEVVGSNPVTPTIY